MPETIVPVHTHNLAHYVTQAGDQTHAVRALIKQLNSVTEGVDPEQGFAKALLDLSWRMKNNAAILKADIHKAHSLPKIPVDPKLAVQLVPIFPVSYRRSRISSFL